MIVRRAFYYAQPAAAFVLPAWLLVGWGLFGGGGLAFVLVVCGSIALAVAMLVVGGLTVARRSVRTARAVSWVDVGVLAAWYAAAVAVGFYLSWGGVLVVVAMLLALVGFWTAAAQLFSETRRRMREAFAAYPSAAPDPRPARSSYTDGEYIVIETSRDRGRS